jgi:hypothetical protein
MKRKMLLLLLVTLPISCAPGYYSNVRAVGDGTFLITRVTGGVFGNTNGSLLRCRLVNQRLQCAEVGVP